MILHFKLNAQINRENPDKNQHPACVCGMEIESEKENYTKLEPWISFVSGILGDIWRGLGENREVLIFG